ncbi:innexin unc-9-like [Pecten maximus]|uniref:innexin unc-9-like n=1 Tax=Pecten maximus TaxID=6579 RepID=UPI001458CA5D|nr:innexin unc-9-like [Pecten maximus]
MSRHGLDGKEHTLKYYPWISLILILQAFLFYIPHLLWRLGAVREGFHHAVCLDIIDRHMFERKTDESGRKIKEEVIDSIENYLIRLIGLQDSASSYLTPLIPMGYRYTAWFVAAHFFLIINSVSQFYLLEFLLGIDFMNFGIDYLSQMPNLLWKDPNRFPRTAFCDLTIRQQTNIQLYTVQCALPSNMFTEKMFMFVWIILLGVSILNILSFAYHVTTIQPGSFSNELFQLDCSLGSILVPDRLVLAYLDEASFTEMFDYSTIGTYVECALSLLSNILLASGKETFWVHFIRSSSLAFFQTAVSRGDLMISLAADAKLANNCSLLTVGTSSLAKASDYVIHHEV